MADPQPRLTGGEGYRGTARPFDREHRKVGGSSFTTSQILATVAAVPLGGTLLFIAGLILVGTLIGLALATPVFVIFSPVLVPAALTIGLSLMGFMASGLFGITALSSFSWLTRNVYQMVRGPGTPVTEKMARGMGKLSEAGGQVGHKGREAGQEVIGAGGRGHGHETGKIGGGGHGHEAGKTT